MISPITRRIAVVATALRRRDLSRRLDRARRLQRSRAGFTLVELLVAAGISVLIVVMLGWMLGSLMSSASHATERVDAFRDARAALQMIERDLRNLVPTQWDIRTSPIPTPAPVPITRAAAYFALENIYTDPGTGNQQLYVLVAAKSTGSPAPFLGDVCAVGYYCRWDDQLHAYSLRRFFRNSTNTFTVLQNAAGYASDSDLYVPAASDAVLAAYVWNFKVTRYDGTGAVINTYPYVCDPNATTRNPLPAAIEIAFNAMSPQAGRTVMSVTSDPNEWMNMNPNLVKPHAYEFRTRINLQ